MSLLPAVCSKRREGLSEENFCDISSVRYAVKIQGIVEIVHFFIEKDTVLGCFRCYLCDMGKFIKHYALEIYTVLAMAFMVATSFMNGLSTIRLFVVVFNFLFILHEWEEGAYPGGFVDLISSLLEVNLTDDLRRASRIPTGVFLVAVTALPFIFDDVALFAVTIAVFGCFEGFIHVMGIKIFGLKKKYTPGMCTGLMEAAVGIGLITYLAVNHLAAWYDYLGGFFLFIAMFMCMQKTLTMMVGIRYRDLPKLIRRQLGRIRNRA